MDDKIIDICSEQNYKISVEPCNKERDGKFIRELTKENCFNYLNNTIGWDEARHLQEPRFPERYMMLFHQNNCIGFLSLRELENCLYIHTLQLIKQYRRQGIGTKLLQFVEYIAIKKAKKKIQLTVINGNPAFSLYRRQGFNIIKDCQWSLLMEKTVKIEQ